MYGLYPHGIGPFSGIIASTTTEAFNQSINKTALTTSQKLLDVIGGFVVESNASVVNVNTKQLSITISASVQLNKTSTVVNGKHLVAVVGTNIPFESDINKTSITVGSKQFSVLSGFSGDVLKSSYTLNTSQLAVQSGASSVLVQRSLSVNGRPLTVSTGTNLPFEGIVDKVSLVYNGKTLNLYCGFDSLISPTSFNINGRQLLLGEVAYPVIPTTRLFTLPSKNTVFFLKQK